MQPSRGPSTLPIADAVRRYCELDPAARAALHLTVSRYGLAIERRYGSKHRRLAWLASYVLREQVPIVAEQIDQAPQTDVSGLRSWVVTTTR
jgi:hypothetical protein